MGNKAELLALAERVEALSGADRWIDGWIWKAAEPAGVWWEFDGVWHRRDFDDACAFEAPPRFTASLDAAMGLVPSGWNHGYTDRRGTEPSWMVNAQCWHSGEASTVHGNAPTPALALTAAALRARAEGVA